MIIDGMVEESFLSRVCKEVRKILSDNVFLQSLLTDTKRPLEPIIGDTPLNWKPINRDHQISVYHTCFERFDDEGNGLTNVKGLIYIDVARKLPAKSGKTITDELDRFALTIMEILRSNNEYNSFNQTVDSWEFNTKNLWRDPKNTDEQLTEKLIDYICEMSFVCNYSARHYQYEN